MNYITLLKALHMVALHMAAAFSQRSNMTKCFIKKRLHCYTCKMLRGKEKHTTQQHFLSQKDLMTSHTTSALLKLLANLHVCWDPFSRWWHIQQECHNQFLCVGAKGITMVTGTTFPSCKNQTNSAAPQIIFISLARFTQFQPAIHSRTDY